MFARVITLRFDPRLECIDDTPLRDFIKDKAVLSMREHFFVRNDLPYLAVMVTYAPQSLEPTSAPEKTRKKPDSSWRLRLREAELPLFNSLREWRAERSRREGVPPYVICNNAQLVSIVQARPQSVHALATIEGIGEAKLKKYGPEIVAILAKQSGDGTTARHDSRKETNDGDAHS